jgi:transposase
MVMKRFVTGEDRSQEAVLSGRLDDYVAEDNPVRVVDVFVDRLDLVKLGFRGMIPKATGRPGYHPSMLLKLYIYNYLNRIQSSRRIAKECERNLEVIWLTGRLTPAFKTIADFRKNNGAAICKVCREFVLLCRRLNLLATASTAIDGSKFKAVNSRDRNFTQGKIKKRLEQLEESANRYLAQLASAGRQPSTPEIKITRLKDKLERLKQEMERIKAFEILLAQTEDKQISLTDPDARSMISAGRGTGTVGYNVQCAVETKNHLIIAHEVTNVGLDNNQLSSMAEQAREALGAETIETVVDRGYYKGEEIFVCEQAGVTVYAPKPLTSGSKAKGRFGKQDFSYDAEADIYVCPANKRLSYWCSTRNEGKNMRIYCTNDCYECLLREKKCTTGERRLIQRWEHEDVLDAVQARLDRKPEMMVVRRSTVEHPFGTIKFWMGAVHFLTKMLPNVRTEMALHVLSYNLKRVMNILGIGGILQAMRA